MDSDGPKEEHGGAHWHNLANMIELSMCGGNATFLSNYFDHLLLLLCPVLLWKEKGASMHVLY